MRRIVRNRDLCVVGAGMIERVDHLDRIRGETDATKKAAKLAAKRKRRIDRNQHTSAFDQIVSDRPRFTARILPAWPDLNQSLAIRGNSRRRRDRSDLIAERGQ